MIIGEHDDGGRHTILCEQCRVNEVPEELLEEMICYECTETDQYQATRELQFDTDDSERKDKRYWPQEDLDEEDTKPI